MTSLFLLTKFLNFIKFHRVNGWKRFFMTLSVSQSREATNHKANRRKCQFCGKSYRPRREHGKFHQPRCRFLAYQQRKEEALRARIVEEMKAKLAS